MQKKTEINGKEMTYSDEWTSEPQVLIRMESVAGKPYSVSLTEAEARRVVALFDACNNKKFFLTKKHSGKESYSQVDLIGRILVACLYFEILAIPALCLIRNEKTNGGDENA